MSNSIADAGQAQFTEGTAKLLPSSSWNLWHGCGIDQLVNGPCAAIVALHADLAEISEVESDPRTTAELRPDWLTAYGLPEESKSITDSI